MLWSSMGESGSPGSQPHQAVASTATMVYIGMPQSMCGLARCTTSAWGVSLFDMLSVLSLHCHMRLSVQKLRHKPPTAIEKRSNNILQCHSSMEGTQATHWLYNRGLGGAMQMCLRSASPSTHGN